MFTPYRFVVAEVYHSLVQKLESTSDEWKDTVALIRLFRPWRQAYFLKTEEWAFTSNSYLSRTLIRNAFRDPEYRIGWFASYTTNVIGLDLDCHRVSSAWSDDMKPRRVLTSLYSKLRERIAVPPSLLSPSPRGLHVYYLLDLPSTHMTFGPILKELLAGLPIEIKPSPYTTLRIPVKPRLVDSDLRPLYPNGRGLDAPVAWEDLSVYQPDGILGADWRDYYRAKVRSHDGTYGDVSLSMNELTLLPFADGRSNDQFLSLVYLYRKHGMSIEETVSHILRAVAESPDYSGSLDDADIVRKRVESSYGVYDGLVANDNLWSEVDHDLVSTQTESIMKKITQLPTFNLRSRHAVKAYVKGLLRWAAFQDHVLGNPALLAHYDVLYPYYRHNRKRGYYPLPSGIQRTWCSRPDRYRTYLIDTGVLVPAPFTYHPRLNVCKYYRIVR